MLEKVLLVAVNTRKPIYPENMMRVYAIQREMARKFVRHNALVVSKSLFACNLKHTNQIQINFHVN